MANGNVLIEEARAEDAEAIINLLDQVAQETSFISDVEVFKKLSLEQLQFLLASQTESALELCLVLKVDQELVGLLNISNSKLKETAHLGELFVVVSEAYQGYGLGQDLIEVALNWIREMGLLKKIELQVQVRNQKAIHVYEKFGFRIEGKRKLAVKTKDGEFLDTYFMGKILED
ncbi:GNAT family N-acetyltransferase [Streptococcus pseudoporcinus]|uniref:Acyl-CoA N-acyltransferase n=1 Tax=Streptococcus pseudoporcinus TaxID=361101 RepID=A0A4U9Y6J7_9STRE|nr:GNAT family protein [Streptococcus pseudoporcinus]VTS21426.1 acyl-CoA N-acyltransferase [Streptococcus pseudoporcinus]VUC69956.1 acyl-CoA N-acyltransferase [Streptococcus pseudoporcinus]VUD00112.1 acyl-CoA N-acyltransferase [Streptococcus pseudoporcinus]VUD00504.1 acyl-CoA N-acyltransferase [Streptococcus pseudoporcinus]